MDISGHSHKSSVQISKQEYSKLNGSIDRNLDNYEE